MTELALPLATLIAAVGLTYVFCVRPMRQGRCAMTPRATTGTAADQRPEQAEIEAARAELAALRASVSGPASSAGPSLGASPPDQTDDRPGGDTANRGAARTG